MGTVYRTDCGCCGPVDASEVVGIGGPARLYRHANIRVPARGADWRYSKGAGAQCGLAVYWDAAV